MAINQKNIVERIPSVLGMDDFQLLLALRGLVSVGWGYHSPLRKKINKLIDEVLDNGYSNKARFNESDFSLTLIKCKKCNDKGWVVRSVKGIKRKVNCKECNND
jgi:hypothetical protein